MVSAVHIGDFHSFPDRRNPQRYAVLDTIIREGEALPDLGVWLWPGDLSHQRQAIEDKNAISLRLIRMAMSAPVVIVYGNHDLPGDLDVFKHLSAKWPIYVISQPECILVTMPTGTARIFCLPYPSKAGLASLGVVPAEVGDVAADALEAIFRNAAADLEYARGSEIVTLMVGHVNVAGSIASTGQPQIGQEIEIGARHLDMLGPIYKGLNHIHKGQEIHGAWYPGSVCRLNWGETEPKRYLQIDFDTDLVLVEEGQYMPFTVIERPIAVPPMLRVEGELRLDGFYSSYDTPPNGSFEGCEVRVRYTFKQSEKAQLNHQLVSDPFLKALRLEVEPIAVPDRALRAPEVASAVTLADKVRAWGTVVGTATPQSLLDKLGRLEHSDAASLIITVQQEIEALAADEQEVLV